MVQVYCFCVESCDCRDVVVVDVMSKERVYTLCGTLWYECEKRVVRLLVAY